MDGTAFGASVGKACHWHDRRGPSRYNTTKPRRTFLNIIARYSRPFHGSDLNLAGLSNPDRTHKPSRFRNPVIGSLWRSLQASGPQFIRRPQNCGATGTGRRRSRVSGHVFRSQRRSPGSGIRQPTPIGRNRLVNLGVIQTSGCGEELRRRLSQPLVDSVQGQLCRRSSNRCCGRANINPVGACIGGSR